LQQNIVYRTKIYFSIFTGCSGISVGGQTTTKYCYIICHLKSSKAAKTEKTFVTLVPIISTDTHYNCVRYKVLFLVAKSQQGLEPKISLRAHV